MKNSIDPVELALIDFLKRQPKIDAYLQELQTKKTN